MSEKNYYALFDKPTPQNLKSNQRGRLTPEQQSTLERAAKHQRSRITFWVLMVSSLFVFMMVVFWIITWKNGISSPQNLIVSIGIVALGLGLFSAYLIKDVVMLFSGDDIKNGQVESVIGKIVWMGRRYKVISNTHKLQSLRFGGALPPPGDYRFYFLPGSGLVVMAEELGTISASQPKDLLLDALARAIRFSMEDLEANRMGSLSSRQENSAIWKCVLDWCIISALRSDNSFGCSIYLEGRIVLYVYWDRRGWSYGNVCRRLEYRKGSSGYVGWKGQPGGRSGLSAHISFPKFSILLLQDR